LIPQRIQRKRSPGWRMPENTVYVGRPSKWGNPFRVGTKGFEYTQAKAVELHENVLFVNKAITSGNNSGVLITIDEIKKELKGKNLACWCKPSDPCHADILLKIANE
jgi:hypothetical protein